MYYLIGDIHGEFTKLLGLMNQIFTDFNAEEDEFIFLGDYIDRGPDSYNVIQYIAELTLSCTVHCIRGNHEQMLHDVLYEGQSFNNYLYNGGQATINSYKKNLGEFYIPEPHKKILFTERLFFETDTFVAVHAGVNPDCYTPESCDPFDLLWIREDFFRTNHRFRKTIIFGHTPTFFITNERNTVYRDDNRNIIGIDTGAVYHGCLTAIRMPDRKIIQQF